MELGKVCEQQIQAANAWQHEVILPIQCTEAE